MAASVVVGARVFAASDDTVAVWAVADDASSGQRLTADDLVSERVRFDDAAELARYYRIDDELPADLTLLRGLGAGELLPRGAVGSAGAEQAAEVSIQVSPGLMPTDVGPGSVVDVYLVAAHGQGQQGGHGQQDQPGPALSGVRVIDAPDPDAGFGPEGDRQVVLAVDDDDVAPFYDRLGALTDPTISIVGHGG